jgi:hypothetical protein
MWDDTLVHGLIEAVVIIIGAGLLELLRCVMMSRGSLLYHG